MEGNSRTTSSVSPGSAVFVDPLRCLNAMARLVCRVDVLPKPVTFQAWQLIGGGLQVGAGALD